MDTNLTPNVFGHLIAVKRSSRMARRIVAHTSGSGTVRWAGFAWHRTPVEGTVRIDDSATERKAA